MCAHVHVCVSLNDCMFVCLYVFMHVLFTSLPVTPDKSFLHAQFILGCYFLTHLYMCFCDHVGFCLEPFFHVFLTKFYWVPVILRDIQVCLC